MYSQEEFVEVGGLASYGIDLPRLAARAAVYCFGSPTRNSEPGRSVPSCQGPWSPGKRVCEGCPTGSLRWGWAVLIYAARRKRSAALLLSAVITCAASCATCIERSAMRRLLSIIS